MNNYNPNIHHRKSIRLKGYDYSQAGLYFITINTKDRACLFGKIVGVNDVKVKNFQPLPRREMILNDAGKIADECWLEIPEHFPNIVLHEHIVMPNHVHGIIELKRVDAIPDNSDMSLQNPNPNHNHNPNPNQFSKSIPGSISVIIQQYKSSVTRLINKDKISNFRWQSRFYEHIIRNEQSYEHIADYIINNPENWKDDNFYNV